MFIENKKSIKEILNKNYVMIRDEDGELLTLLGRDNEGYYVYYMEHCDITESDVEALLDKAAGIAITPVVDEKVLEQYKSQLDEQGDKIKNQIEDDYSLS